MTQVCHMAEVLYLVIRVGVVQYNERGVVVKKLKTFNSLAFLNTKNPPTVSTGWRVGEGPWYLRVIRTGLIRIRSCFFWHLERKKKRATWAVPSGMTLSFASDWKSREIEQPQPQTPLACSVHRTRTISVMLPPD